MSQLFKTMVIICFVYLLPAQETFVINIDLGGTDSELPWNTLTNSNTGKLELLQAMNGQTTSIGMEIYDAFNGTNSNGTTTAATSLEIPAFASEDSFFGNSVEWSGVIQPTAGIKLTGLDTEKTYKLSLFASRLAADNRETAYTIITDETDTTLFLQVSDNVSEIVELDKLKPAANGEITINVQAGPNNNNEYGFYYLGVIRLEYEDELIVQEPTLSLTSPTGGEYWQSAKQPDIRWLVKVWKK